MKINTASDKRDAIHSYLASGAIAAEWYKTEHGVIPQYFTAENVNTYGGGPDAMGDLADMIISYAIDDGFVTEEE